MEAIGLNPIRLDRIGLDPIRVNAIKLGVPGAASGSARPYIDPEVLASLVAVCICDGKSNNDPDRAVIKNLVDSDNPFVISNAAYEGMSGHNGYPVVFGANKTWKQLPTYNSIYSINDNKIHITKVLGANRGLIFSYVKQNDQLLDITEIPSFKIKVSGLKGDSKLRYSYIKTENAVYQTLLDLDNGIHKLPKSLRPTDSIVNESWIGFTITSIVENEITFDCDITIEVLPEYEGAFVTDGKDDLITSTKTVKEMLGGSNEVTVVSMMLNLENEKITYTNQIRPFQNGYIRNNVISNTEGKCGIYGYKITDTSDIFKNRISINDILGDRKDYSMDTGGTARIDGKFSVEGYCFNDGTIGEVSQVAWYWTIISKIALTTDQINQVISYFNLDKHVKPDIIYDTIRQGITNENHASFNDELVDFSGNGHNLKLYNLNWDKQSGIGSYPFSFKDYNYFSDRADVSVNKSNFVLTANFDSNNFLEINTKNTEVPSFKIKAEGIDTITNGRLAYRIAASDGSISVKYISEDGEYEIPGSPLTENAAHSGFYVSGGINDNVRVKVTIIPEHEGALVTDGVSDYGKVTGVPIYKDYTVVADRTVIGTLEQLDGGVSAKCTNYLNGSFVMDYKDSAFSFGGQKYLIHTLSRIISYQSKYISNGKEIVAGNSSDVSDLYVGKLGIDDRYSAIALYSYLLFPYSLSEFLLERQLKRYKLGTLYPDMVEFRPIINVNIGKTYNVFEIRRTDTNELLYYYINGSVPNNKIGSYLPKGTNIRILVKWDNNRADVTQIKFNGKEYELNRLSDNSYYIDVTLDKSPQKIDIYADEYIRYENIVQPYPAIINLKQDGKTITWGDKLKVGSDIVFAGSANLLPELYTVSETRYNGVTLYPNTIIKVEKSMVFDNARTYLKANEPSCILSPNRLRIPNSSYKILGYIPDLTGKGNHGRLNNFAYTEESGANEDGSIRFDGKDDHITIPTIKHGGKCMLMKVNWNKDALMLYDQRRDNNPNSFAIYIPNFNNEDSIAYSSRNDGKTYIDGVLNTSVKGSQLKDVTHNITITNSNSNNDNTVSPAIGSNAKYNAFYAQMALFDFMLFPEISSEDEIKELNECVGIEGNVWGTLTQLINSTLISNETLIKNE